MKVSDARQTVSCYLHAHLIFFVRLFLSPILRSMQDSHSQEMRGKGKQPAHFTSSQLLRGEDSLYTSGLLLPQRCVSIHLCELLFFPCAF